MSLLLLPSCNPSLVSAASTEPGFMAKRAEKTKFDRYPHINLVPFILETTFRPGPHARKFIAHNPPIAVRDTWSTIQSVLHSAISHGSRYVTLGDCCHTQFVSFAPCLRMQVPTRRERKQPFQSQACCCCAMWPCCDITSSDDDEHNTDSNFLLLLADVDIAPTLLEGLTEVDVLHIAFGCRFALAYSRFRSNFLLHLITSHFLTTLSSLHSEHWLHTSATFVMSANWLGPRSFQFSSKMLCT